MNTDITPLLNQIHHCDCFELLARLPDKSVDMALLDLPYGVTACKWDTPIPLEPLWSELKRVCKQRAAIVMTATQPFTSRLVSSNYEMFRYEWVWIKNASSSVAYSEYQPMRYTESILIFYEFFGIFNKQIEKRTSITGLKRAKHKIGSSKSSNHHSLERLKPVMYNPLFINPKNTLFFDIPLRYQGMLHPTQKPVALFEYLIKTYTQPGEIVLDFVCGSGTTAIAARKTGRDFICGDMTLEYVELARKRLQDTDPYQSTELSNGMKQLSLFEELS